MGNSDIAPFDALLVEYFLLIKLECRRIIPFVKFMSDTLSEGISAARMPRTTITYFSIEPILRNCTNESTRKKMPPLKERRKHEYRLIKAAILKPFPDLVDRFIMKSNRDCQPSIVVSSNDARGGFRPLFSGGN